MNQDIESSNRKSLTVSETWIKALTQPTVEGYEEIVRDPNASPGKAFSWLIVASIIGNMIYLVIGNLLGTNALGSLGEDAFGSSMVTFLWLVPIGALFGVIIVAIVAGITQFIASLLGGTGSYSELIYAFSAYMSPLSLVSYTLSAIPFINCLALPLGLYGIYLNIVAVKAVHQFSWGKAIASSIMILLLLLFLAACIVIVILVLLGPAIGNVFSDIMMELETPGY